MNTVFDIANFIPDPKYFDIKEFVSIDIFNKYGNRSWIFLDPRILMMVECLRNNLNKSITINNWHLNGSRYYSGFREITCKIGAMYSQHRFGRALDLLVKDMTAHDVRQHILQNSQLYPFITRMEEKHDGKEINWVHIDCANNINKPFGIELFNV